MSYKKDELLQLIDGVILDSSNHMEVFRVIQIGLLCVQHDPKDRPVMSQVVLMLSSYMKLPHPKQPGFFIERNLLEADYLSSNSEFSSSNNLTITTLLPREQCQRLRALITILICISNKIHEMFLVSLPGQNIFQMFLCSCILVSYIIFFVLCFILEYIYFLICILHRYKKIICFLNEFTMHNCTIAVEIYKV